MSMRELWLPMTTVRGPMLTDNAITEIQGAITLFDWRSIDMPKVDVEHDCKGCQVGMGETVGLPFFTCWERAMRTWMSSSVISSRP